MWNNKLSAERLVAKSERWRRRRIKRRYKWLLKEIKIAALKGNRWFEVRNEGIFALNWEEEVNDEDFIAARLFGMKNPEFKVTLHRYYRDKRIEIEW